MTDNQKSFILALRDEGFSYTEIAEKLHISRNTVKSFCRSHKAPTPAQPIKRNHVAIGYCRTCGAELDLLPGHKQKQFCNDICRHRWFNRQNARKPYILTCQYCNREFVSYGNPHKKYCSRDCIEADRKRGGSHA